MIKSALVAATLMAPHMSKAATTPHYHASAQRITAPRHQAMAQINRSLARDLAGNAQFIGLGDTDHRDLSISAFMAQESTMATLAAAGVKNIFIEFPPSLQYLTDDLAAGKISAADYVKGMGNNYQLFFENEEQSNKLFALRAAMILNAKKYGIAVHNADSDTSIEAPSDKDLSDFTNKMAQAEQDAINNNPALAKRVSAMSVPDQIQWQRNFIADYISKLPAADVDRINQIINNNLLKQRLASDGAIAKHIKEEAGSERAVIFYGAEHQPDFARALGTEKIALLGSDPSIATQYLDASGWRYYALGASPGASTNGTTGPAAPAHPPRRTAAKTGPNLS